MSTSNTKTSTKPIAENIFLRELASLSGQDIVFKDENILPGTATIGPLPIDIGITNKGLILNSVGEFSGDYISYGKSLTRGKGYFRNLIPYIILLLGKYNIPLEVYLCPLSPVWRTNYTLKEVDIPISGCYFFLDLGETNE